MTGDKETLEHIDKTADLIRAKTAHLKEYIYKREQTPLELTTCLYGDTGSLGESITHLQKAKARIDNLDMHIRGVADSLDKVAMGAMELLLHYGVEDFEEQFAAEYKRAAAKHPGMTLETDNHRDDTRFYALAEEVGEVAASLTYDNDDSTGHMADTIAEITQVGALALAWLTRYQDVKNNRNE